LRTSCAGDGVAAVCHAPAILILSAVSAGVGAAIPVSSAVGIAVVFANRASVFRAPLGAGLYYTTAIVIFNCAFIRSKAAYAAGWTFKFAGAGFVVVSAIAGVV